MMINVKDEVYKNGYRQRSCTSKTAKKSPFRQICNVLFHQYSVSSILLNQI